jgi:hypothetical protein
MEKLLASLKERVIEESKNQGFVHHEWFAKYHLEIVEKIALETCEIYQDADRNIVSALVWVHDYGKIVDFENQYAIAEKEVTKILTETGFEKGFVEKVVEYVGIMDSKLTIDINEAPLEVRIISSADGASHFIGPFFSLWWQDNAGKNFKELMEDNRVKALKDWNRKMVIPEIRKAFEPRYRFLLEQSGDLPEKYLG